MFLRKLDFISPNITLYFHRDLRHSSVVSGIISIIAALIILITSCIFIADIFSSKEPNAFYFQKHVNDTGYYEIGPKGIFHFITFGNDYQRIDKDKIKIYGIMTRPSIFLNEDKNMNEYDHWEYDFCTKYPEYLEIKSNSNLYYYFKSSNMNGLCISAYYNSQTKSISKIGESNFKFPFLDHGASSKNLTNYGLYIIKNGDVESSYMNSLSLYTIHFVDNFVDVDNYNTPFTPFIYNLTTSFSINSFTINNLNFNPAYMRTHHGIILDTIKIVQSYSFVQNEKISYESIPSKKQIVGSFYFWMQNRADVYQRSYKKLQDALANISGVSKVVTVIAYLINKVYCDYVTVDDLNKIFELNLGQKSFQKRVSGFGTAHFKHTVTLNTVVYPGKTSTRKLANFNFFGVLLHKLRFKRLKIVEWITEYRARVLSEEKIYKLYRAVKIMKKKTSDCETQNTNTFKIVKRGEWVKKLNHVLQNNHYVESQNNTVDLDKENLVLK